MNSRAELMKQQELRTNLRFRVTGTSRASSYGPGESLILLEAALKMSVGFIRALRIAVLLVAACILVPATTVSAQTTGRIVGQISDAQGAVLPGVTVTVSSQQGTQ